MNPLVTFIVFAALAWALWSFGDRLKASGRTRAGKTVRVISLAVGLLSIFASRHEQEKRTAKSISASLALLEKRIQEGDKQAALEIVDRGIRFFTQPAELSRSAEALYTFASSLAEKQKPNQTSEPTA